LYFSIGGRAHGFKFHFVVQRKLGELSFCGSHLLLQLG
jgi:hypothetical protein